MHNNLDFKNNSFFLYFTKSVCQLCTISPFHRDDFVTLTYFSKSSWLFHNLLWENVGTFYHKPRILVGTTHVIFLTKYKTIYKNLGLSRHFFKNCCHLADNSDTTLDISPI